ncbi:MAG: PAS domain S-box protein [Nitrospinae bacterium]|nr:PAS domain S-box protein [Nitrospinota bacterium]
MRNKNGDLSGMADSYKNLIETKLPVTFVLAPELPWEKVLDDAKDKKIDAVLLLGRTDERDKYLLFTDVLVDLPYVIITSAENRSIRGERDLPGRRVSVRSKFVSQEWLESEFPDAALFPKETTLLALDAVLTGEVDAYVGSMADAVETIGKNRIGNLRVSARTSFVNHLRIGVRKDWPELASVLNKAIRDISPKEHNAIWNLWVPFHHEWPDSRIVYALVACLAAIVIVGLYFYAARLRKVDKELKDVTRRLTILSGCNQLLLKNLDEQTFLHSTVQIIKDLGGYEFVHVYGPPTATTYFHGLDGTLPTQETMADCPCNKAFSENKTVIVNDILQYDEKSRWRDVALKNGCKSAIMLPVMFSEKTDAVLSIYSVTPGMFSDKEIAILEELAQDLSLGVRTTRERERGIAIARRVRESEVGFRSLVETATDAIISVDSSGMVTFWNSSAAKMFGYAADEVIGKNLVVIIPERHRALHRAGLESVASGGVRKIIGATVATEGLKKGGDEFPVELTLATWEVDGEKFFTAIIRDISERKMAEESLRKSQEDFKQIIKNSSVAMALTDADEKVLLLNGKFVELFGYDESDIPNVEAWWPLAYPDPKYREDVKAVWNERVNAVICDKAVFVPMETSVVCKDGGKRVININFSYIGNRGLTVFYDLTKRKAMEDEILASHKMLANAQELANMGHWDMDVITGKGTWSDGSFKIFGLEPGAWEPTFVKFLGMVHPDDRKYIEQCMRDVLSGKLSKVEFDARIIRPDGQERVIHDKLEVISYADGKPVKITGVNVDITERKRYERKLEIANDDLKSALEEIQRGREFLMRSEKLASVGTLAAGVAHEILNPLNIISTVTQLMLMDERRGRFHDNLKEIMLQVGRASKITNNLRMFAREKKFDLGPVDVNALFDHTAGLVEHDMSLDNIFIERRYDSDISLVMADSDQLAQVFLNLLTNARDALKPGRGGVITVSTKATDDGVEFTMRDNGPGIPPDVMDRIFDPFFTTKEPGEGTGLGLAISHRIIENHRGTITVESVDNAGASFKIFLPKECPLSKKPDKLKNASLKGLQ